MDTENEDVDFADIEKLKKVLAEPKSCEGSSEDEDIEDYEINDSNDEDPNLTNVKCEVIGDFYPHLDLDDIELDDESPSPRMCRALGSSCYDLLYTIEKQLLALIDNCRTKMKDLQSRIDATRSPADKMSCAKGTWYYMFGIPYFKDQHFFPCPPNEDYLQKIANKELCIVDLPPLRQWKNHYKERLEEAIQEEEIENKIKQYESKKNSILKNIGETSDAREKNKLKQSLKEYDKLIEDSQNMSLLELVGTKKSEYDWMRISVSVMENYHSPEECRAMWHNYLHPKIVKTKWTTEEDNRLIALANKYKHQNWEAIAEELGTNRSGYQCMCQYQTRLNSKIKKSKWTKEEDSYLMSVIESCRIGSYIPWAKVTSYMDGRSKNQVFNRWAYSLDPNIKRGRFTKEEDCLVVAAVRRYGTSDFKRVARFLPGRTSIQVRDRYNLFLKKHTGPRPWTADDDTLLMALVKQYGEGHWSEISQHFANRTRTQVRHRFSTIKNWMEKVPEECKENSFAPTRRLSNTDDNREEKVWGRVQSLIPNIKTATDIDELSLLQLRERLQLEKKRRPGRRIGQKKAVCKIDKQFYNFFRCVYAQFGGRKKLRFKEDTLKDTLETMRPMLHHFKANLKIPMNNDIIENEPVLESLDKAVLCSLRDRKYLSTKEEAEEKREPIEESIPTENLKASQTLSTPTSKEVSNPSTFSVSSQNETPVSDASTSQDLPSSSTCEFVHSNVINNKVQIPYLCPPNHTTLVGFRTLLLSRRNLTLTPDSKGRKTVSFSDPEREISDSCITPTTAAALWKERLTSMFVWPAVMSNTVPGDSAYHHVLKEEISSEGSDGGYEYISANIENVSTKRKAKKYIPKKRKCSWKKKKDEMPPLKKRKYEMTGKFKKPDSVKLEKPTRRSARTVARLKSEETDVSTPSENNLNKS